MTYADSYKKEADAAKKLKQILHKKKRGRKSQKAVAIQTSGRRFRGKDYTSTRVRKDLMGLLRLLYDNMTSVEMLECLIIQHLEQNKRLLAKKVANIKLDI